MDAVPFDLDKQINETLATLPLEQGRVQREFLSKVFSFFAEPFIKQGYVATAALNRGIASFSVHMDNVTRFLEEATEGTFLEGLERGGGFEEAAKLYEENAEYWQAKAEERGLSVIDEIIGEAAGGAVPGVAQFSFDVASGYTFPFMDGAYRGSVDGESPVARGVIEAAKTGVLHHLFRLTAPLKKYLQTPAMGTIFGLQEAAEAPSGEKAAAFGRGAATGALYSMASPGGRYGLNEVTKAVKPELERFKKQQINQEVISRIEIPDFKTTGEAVAFGEKATPEQIVELEKRRTETQARVKELQTVKDFGTEMSDMAYKGQLYREAIEASKGEHPSQRRKDGAEAVPGSSTKLPPAETPQAPSLKPRKFLQTIEKSTEIDPSVKELVKKIDPQEYAVKPNIETENKVKQIIANDPDAAETMVREPTALTAEKSAMFRELIKKNQNERNFDKASELIDLLDQQAREAGQGIQFLSRFVDTTTPEGFIRWANKQLERTRSKYSWADTLLKRKPENFRLSRIEEKQILEKFREIDGYENAGDRADATLELVDMIAQKVPPSVGELIDAYRYQNMLSSPKTYMRNIGYNMEAVFLARPWDITTRAAVDYTKAGLTGKDREFYVREVPLYLKTAVNAVPNAVEAFKQTMKLSAGATLEKPDLGVEARTRFESARAAQIPSSLTFVQRFMEACDKFNMALMAAGEFAVNKKNGMTDIEAMSKASEVAKDYLLRGDIDPKNPKYSYPSKLLADLYGMIKWTRKAPVLGLLSKIYIPFIKTPINLGISMIEYSPVGAIRPNFDSRVAARLLSGGIATALGALAAYKGETTWSAPTNDKEKELFYAAGRKPFSVKMGDKWVPFWYLGPFALAFGLPAAVKYYTEDSKSSLTDNASEKLFNISEGVAQFVGSQSSTQSIGALFSALDGDIDYKLSSQTGFTITQMIPGSAMVRYVNTILDPVYRHPHGVIEGIESGIPWLSEKLDAYTTPFLEESRRDPVNYFLPYDLGKEDELHETLYDLSTIEVVISNGKKLDALTQRMKDNPLSVSKYMQQYSKIFEENAEVKTRGLDLKKDDGTPATSTDVFNAFLKMKQNEFDKEGEK